METEILKGLTQLSVGVAALFVLFLCFKVFVEALNKRDHAFKEYVESNNHKSVEVMAQCRDAIKEASENIRQSTDMQKHIIHHIVTYGKK